MKKESSVSGGTSFCSLLAIVFIVLKLLNIISWSWWWVLSPLWLPFAIAIAIYLLSVVYVFIRSAAK